ncbi:hypothetical protein ACDP95_10625 [Weissella confusa]
MRSWRSLVLPGGVLLLASVVLVLPQLISNMPIIGIDALFHFNRFYDIAEQIKHGQFNYFMSEYGYQHSGRIVTPLYGPWLSYLMGFVLMLIPNWFWFEIVTDIAILLVAGAGIYRLGRYLKSGRYASLVSAVIYMALPLTTTWQTSQSFTGIGAALLPYVVYYGITMTKQPTTFSWVGLAISLAVLTQAHLFTALLGVLVLGILFVVTVIGKNKATIIALMQRLLKAVILYGLLVANVLVGMTDVMGSNQILTPYTPLNISREGMRITLSQSPTLRNYSWLGVIAVIVLIVAVLVYRKLAREYRFLFWLAVVFFSLSLTVFPWDAIQQIEPTIVDTMQFPSRLSVVSNIALVLLLPRILMMPDVKRQLNRRLRLVIVMIAIVVPVAISASILAKSAHRLHTDELVHVTKHMVFNDKKSKAEIARGWRYGDVQVALADVQKATPDYLVNNGLQPGDNSYDMYMREVIQNPLKAQVTQGNNALTYRWHSGNEQQITVPVAVYAHSKVVLNGQQVTNPQTTRIGTLQVRPRVGQNTVTISYDVSPVIKIIVLGNAVLWAGLVIFMTGKTIWRNGYQIKV